MTAINGISPFFENYAYMTLPQMSGITLVTSIEMTFRRHSESGVLLHTGGSSNSMGGDYITIGILNGILMVYIDLGNYLFLVCFCLE